MCGSATIPRYPAACHYKSAPLRPRSSTLRNPALRPSLPHNEPCGLNLWSDHAIIPCGHDAWVRWLCLVTTPHPAGSLLPPVSHVSKRDLKPRNNGKSQQFASPIAHEDTYRIFPSISTQEPIPCLNGVSGPVRSPQPFRFGSVFGRPCQSQHMILSPW